MSAPFSAAVVKLGDELDTGTPAVPSLLCGALTTARINAAITALAAAGGGVLRLGAAVYTGFTSSIRLMDGVELDGQGATLVQDPTAPAFRLIVNDDAAAGNQRIAVSNIVLDGARQNAETPEAWGAGRTYVIGDEVFNQAAQTIYVCVQGGVSGGAIPVGVGNGIVDGTVIWDYVCPLWVPGADLLYFTRCRDVRLRNVTCRNSRNDGAIIEGSVDVGSIGNLGREVSIVDCRFAENNKAGLYVSSGESVDISTCQFIDNFMGLALACAWYCAVVGNTARDNVYGNGILIGRDTRFCTIVGNDLDGINAVVEAISSAPLTLHGKIYPNVITIVVTPNVVGATAYNYWVVARDAGGSVIAVSSTASGAILNGAAGPDNTITWAAVAGAASYDVLKRVAGYPQLIVNQPGVNYTDLGAATSAYDYEEAYTSFGFSDCVIADNVINNGVITLRKGGRNEVAGNLSRNAGATQDVSSPHAVDLQGSRNNHLHDNRAVDGFNTSAGIGLESFVDNDFGETLYSEVNVVEENQAFDTRAAPTTFAIAIAVGNERNVIRRNFANIPNDLPEPTTIAYENTGPSYTNGFALFAVGAEAGNTIDVTVTLPVLGESMVRVWLSDTERGAPTAVPPTGGFTTTTGVDIYSYTANVMRDIQSNAAGQIVVRLIEAAAKSFYLCIGTPGRTAAQIVTFV